MVGLAWLHSIDTIALLAQSVELEPIALQRLTARETSLKAEWLAYFHEPDEAICPMIVADIFVFVVPHRMIKCRVAHAIIAVDSPTKQHCLLWVLRDPPFFERYPDDLRLLCLLVRASELLRCSGLAQDLRRDHLASLYVAVGQVEGIGVRVSRLRCLLVALLRRSRFIFVTLGNQDLLRFFKEILPWILRLWSGIDCCRAMLDVNDRDLIHCRRRWVTEAVLALDRTVRRFFLDLIRYAALIYMLHEILELLEVVALIFVHIHRFTNCICANVVGCGSIWWNTFAFEDDLDARDGDVHALNLILDLILGIARRRVDHRQLFERSYVLACIVGLCLIHLLFFQWVRTGKARCWSLQTSLLLHRDAVARQLHETSVSATVEKSVDRMRLLRRLDIQQPFALRARLCGPGHLSFYFLNIAR